MKMDPREKEVLDQLPGANCGACGFAGCAAFAVDLEAALKLPLRDGDLEREDDAYKGCWFINANSKTAPQVVDRHVQPIIDRSEIYSGVYARVSISLYAFSVNGNKGVACGLGNIQKIRDGEPLGGHTNASNDFDAVDDGDEDFLN